MSDGRVASASGSAASRARLGRVSTSGHLSSRLLPHGRAGSAGRPGPAGTAAYPAAGYPNWTLTPADAAFANQPGLLRQQITTDPVASGAQPVLYTGSDAAPDRVDSTIDYTGQSALAPSTAWRWSGLLTAPANPGGTGWQLKVFVANQASSQLFVDSLTTNNGGGRKINIGAYPANETLTAVDVLESR